MRFFKSTWTAALLASSLLLAPAAFADTVQLPDETQTTTFTATVSEQITVTVPAAVAFDVTDTNAATPAAAATLDITAMALDPGNHLQVSIAPDATGFTAPDSGTTWASSDVSWNAASAGSFTGSAGTMSASAGTYTVVGTCAAGVNTCATTGLVFTLAAKPTVNEAGAHTLVATWKFESLGI